jgi:hypothetical protein
MRRQEMEARLRSEMDDITERLRVAHSDGLHTCNEFWSWSRLVELTHSDRKWIKLDALDSSSTRRAISRALRRNRHAIYATITIHDTTTLEYVKEVIRGSSSLTTLAFVLMSNVEIADLFACATPNILSITWRPFGHVRCLSLPSLLVPILRDHCDQLSETTRTAMSITGMIPSHESDDLQGDGSIAVRFHGPSSSLVLRLIHHCGPDGMAFTFASRDKETTNETRLSIPGSDPGVFISTNITLHSRVHSSEPQIEPIFEPHARNTLQVTWEDSPHYVLRDIQLLDEAGEPYQGRESQ